MMAKPKRAALYDRVSTGHQSVENQIRELKEVVGRRGWTASVAPRDEISGPALLKDASTQVRCRHCMGHRPARPIADRPAGHHPAPRGRRRRSLPGPTIDRYHHPGGQAAVTR
jgi:hypothetical protein